MTDAMRLHDLVETWHATAGDVVALLRELSEEDWSRPTDLPGWDVRAVAAHCAHLESELAGNPQEQVDVPEADHVKGLMGQFTEAGVLARAGRSAEELVDELERSVAARYAALTAEPPTEAAAPGPGFAGLIGWSWETLLSNRPLDLWMHEQDVRRATGRPGDLDTDGARHVLGVFTRSLGYVLGKRAKAPVGSTLVVELPDAPGGSCELAVQVGEDGRGRPLDAAPADPTVRLRLGFEGFVVLSGGRRSPDRVDATVEGDEELARRVLAGMAVTP